MQIFEMLLPVLDNSVFHFQSYFANLSEYFVFGSLPRVINFYFLYIAKIISSSVWVKSHIKNTFLKKTVFFNKVYWYFLLYFCYTVLYEVFALLQFLVCVFVTIKCSIRQILIPNITWVNAVIPDKSQRIKFDKIPRVKFCSLIIS